jgi:uncharacterized membrane protein YgcG
MANGRILVGLLLLVANMSLAVAAGDVPQIRSRVNDHAKILSESQKHQMYQVSAQHQFAKHHQVVVVTAESAGGDSAPAYAERIWQAWQPQKKSSSVLLLLIKEPKSALIVAGDEVGKVLNDIVIKNMIDEKVSPTLLQGDYDNAAMEGLKAIVGELNR